MSTYRTKALPKPPGTPGTTREHACCCCDKPIARGRITRMVHLVDGGGQVLHPQDEHLYQSDEGDCLWLPIGSECVKRLGKAWSIHLEKPE